jgi:hypothetical protein
VGVEAWSGEDMNVPWGVDTEDPSDLGELGEIVLLPEEDDERDELNP